ncbi:MAG: hypothetical protein NUW01_08770 [Gemmatimonadaceae bacterium]|nr:hypothetical protein [Gemmatimonadaceae bacterium]
MISRGIAIGVALLALAPAPASAQDTRLSARLDARTASAVMRVVDSARAQALPTEPLVQKALQGAAKRAPSERVLAAVRELLAELGTARTSLGARSTEAELVAGAGALHAGVPAATLTRVRALRGGQSVTVALGTLADLVARGVPVNGAVSAVLSLVERRATDADFLEFGNQVGRDIAAGAPPAVAARVRSGGPGSSGARPATVPGRPDNAAPRGRGRRPTGQVNPGRS